MGETFREMSSLQRPKQFSFIGTDGITYNFLAKDGDDLRLDARVSELFQMFNHFLATDQKSRDRGLSLRSYHVTPLGKKKGLIEWIPDLKGFKDCCKPAYERQGKLNKCWQMSNGNTEDPKEDRIKSYKKHVQALRIGFSNFPRSKI